MSSIARAGSPLCTLWVTMRTLSLARGHRAIATTIFGGMLLIGCSGSPSPTLETPDTSTAPPSDSGGADVTTPEPAEAGGDDAANPATDAFSGNPDVADASPDAVEIAEDADAGGADASEGDARDGTTGEATTETDSGADAEGSLDASSYDATLTTDAEADAPTPLDATIDGTGSVGCDATCIRLTPSNLPSDICDTPGTGTLNVTSTNNTIDTGTGCDLVVTQSGGPDICVRKFATVVSFGTTQVTGARALAIVATDSMRLAGTLDASGRAVQAGPGAADSLGAGTNGSGAGHAGAGADGPDSVSTSPPFPSASTTPGSAGGAAYGNSNGIPLLGGATGGQGGGPPASTLAYGKPGAGGGAIQLVACGSLVLGASPPLIDVSGGAGRGGNGSQTTIAQSGGGGGSGGAILVEALQISVESGATGPAQLTALGGGGGGGGGYMATGGDGSGSTGGIGATNAGNGGSWTGATAQKGGASLTTSGGSTGIFTFGGGGSAGAPGYIRLNVLQPVALDAGAFMAIPPMSLGVVGTH